MGNLNYLAHIYLSYPDDEEMLGNFLGDFVRSKDIEYFPETVQKGINLHRQIDEFTDQHPAFKSTVEILRPTLGKYAPVALDVYNDYFLCRNWENLNTISLREFCNNFYGIIQNAELTYPSKLSSRLSLMLENDFLMSTANENNLIRSLQHLDRRSRFSSNFEGSFEVMQRNVFEFEESFQLLFKDLRGLVKIAN